MNKEPIVVGSGADRSATSLTEQPEIVLVEETGAGRFQASVRAGTSTFLADEPRVFGGLSSGPNPFELLAAALGACTTMTLRLYAQRKGWDLPPLYVAVRHRRRRLDSRDGFEREIVFPERVGPEQVSRLLAIAGRCPVHLLLERGADVTTVASFSRSGSAITGPQHCDQMGEACAD